MAFEARKEEVQDLMGLHPFEATVIRPGSLEKLREAVATAKGPVRAVGSKYSLSTVGIAKNGLVIETDLLNKFLSLPAPWRHVPFDRGVDDWSEQFLRRTERGKELSGVLSWVKEPEDGFFVHVEAGMQIRELLRGLEACGLTLPTMGSGGGQSVAGALATASHGGDINEPLLVNAIAAIHLVNQEGRSVWISEAGEEAIPPPDHVGEYVERLHAVHEDVLEPRHPGSPFMRRSGGRLDPETQVWLKNGDALRATAVAMGRAGVIYSLVLRVVKMYSLLECNATDSASNLIEAMKNETILGCPPERYLHGPKIDAEDSVERTKQQELSDRIEAACGEVEDKNLFHLNVAINLAAPRRSWVTRRWKSTKTVSAVELAPRPDLGEDAEPKSVADTAIEVLLGQKDSLDKMVSRLLLKILEHPDVDNSLELRFDHWYTELPANFFLTRIGGKMALRAIALSYVEAKTKRLGTGGAIFIAPMRVIHWKITQLLTDKMIEELKKEKHWFIPEERLSAANVQYLLEALMDRFADFREKNKKRTWYALLTFIESLHGDEELVRELPKRFGITTGKLIEFIGDKLMSTEYSKSVRIGPASRILDTHNYKMDGVASSHAGEFFFNRNHKLDGELTYVKFIQRVIELSETYAPVLGFIGVRFMPAATATLGMQRWPQTVSIEVGAMRSTEEAAAADGTPHATPFFKAVLDEAVAISRMTKTQAVPHWGQEFTHEKKLLEELYEGRMGAWRAQMTALGACADDGFSTTFSKRYGLEP